MSHTLKYNELKKELARMKIKGRSNFHTKEEMLNALNEANAVSTSHLIPVKLDYHDNLNDLLEQAVYDNDLFIIDELIDRGADQNEVMLSLVEQGDLPGVKLLLSYPLNVQDEALNIACANNDLEMCKLLITDDMLLSAAISIALKYNRNELADALYNLVRSYEINDNR